MTSTVALKSVSAEIEILAKLTENSVEISEKNFHEKLESYQHTSFYIHILGLLLFDQQASKNICNTVLFHNIHGNMYIWSCFIPDL